MAALPPQGLIPVQPAPPEPVVIDVTAYDTVLDWIGFTIPAQRAAIMADIAELKDCADLKKNHMQSLADSFSRRTISDGRLLVGVSRTKRLTELIQWVSDFKRVEEKITIAGLNKASFREAILFAAGRADNRAAQKAAEKSSDDTTPGKLKDDCKWNTWITEFHDMLREILGVSGVLLSYIICESDGPEPGYHQTYEETCISDAPLSRPNFEADAKRVHNIIIQLVQGEHSEQWIKNFKSKQDGCADLKALTSYYQGEGNTTRRISEAEILRETLHYKSERALPFGTFLHKLE